MITRDTMQSNQKNRQTSLPPLSPTPKSYTSSPTSCPSSSSNRYFVVPTSPSSSTAHEWSSAMHSSESSCRSPLKSPQLPKSPLRSPQLPKSPKEKCYQLSSPQQHTPTSHPNAGNYFNFNVPQKQQKGYTKALSQSDDQHKRQMKNSEYKTLLTKTQSEPRSTVTFEVNNQPFEPKKYEANKCNIHTNPGYLIQTRNDSLESGETVTTTTTTTTGASSDSSRRRRSSNSTHRCRKSTSDLTDLTDLVSAGSTTVTSVSRPSSPRRRGSMKGGLAYLASRRGSKDSTVSITEEDIGPLNFQNTNRNRHRRTSNFLELPVPDHIRPRVYSLPEKAFNPRLSDDLYRLRTFSITNKGGVVNCGDSIINRRSKSNTSVNSTASKHSAVSNNGSPFDGASSCCSAYHAVDSSSIGSEDSRGSLSQDSDVVHRYRVVLLGDAGVGKTALVSQFMTSEYMNTYDASLDDEFGEKTVSILLDGEESEMIFIDHPTVEMSVENSLATYEPHACVVVYSIVAKESFKVAEDILSYLWRENYTHEKSVIVVGNKADLARSRVISTNDGKSLAISRDCKFIETSSGIQHNVDELLVGILKQIRLRELRDKKKSANNTIGSTKSRRKLHGSKTSLSLNIAREILQKMCLNDISKSKSCENLHVL